MTNYIISRFLRVKSSSNIWTPFFTRGNASKVLHQTDILTEAIKRRPQNPFVLFLSDFKAKSVEEGLFTTGGFKVRALQRWQNISENEKLKYMNIYQQNVQSYYDELYEIFKGIPDLSQLNGYEERIFKKVVKVQQEKKEKPIKPMTDFLLYVKEHVGKIHLDEIARSWLKLDSAVKKKYQEIAHKNLSDYRENLEKWESKMLEQGHLLLVRKKSREQYLKMKNN